MVSPVVLGLRRRRAGQIETARWSRSGAGTRRSGCHRGSTRAFGRSSSPAGWRHASGPRVATWRGRPPAPVSGGWRSSAPTLSCACRGARRGRGRGSAEHALRSAVICHRWPSLSPVNTRCTPTDRASARRPIDDHEDEARRTCPPTRSCRPGAVCRRAVADSVATIARRKQDVRLLAGDRPSRHRVVGERLEQAAGAEFGIQRLAVVRAPRAAMPEGAARASAASPGPRAGGWHLAAGSRRGR
jgi:hypothetical protein